MRTALVFSSYAFDGLVRSSGGLAWPEIVTFVTLASNLLEGLAKSL